MNILVGCPLSRREWILPEWKRHTDIALEGHDVSFHFVTSRHDVLDLNYLEEWQQTDGNVTWEFFPENRRADVRDWRAERVRKMVELRNTLLETVREREPEIFFSLDSDILLHPEAVSSALELFRDPEVWAVGLKCFMTPEGFNYPSNAMNKMDGKGHARLKLSEALEVDIIMAAKLMKPDAYNVNYCFQPFGEDGGWSDAVTEAGGKLMWDGRITNKHVMKPEYLDVVDPRAGF